MSNPKTDKSIGKIAEEYGVSYSLAHEIDARIRKDYEQSEKDRNQLFGKPEELVEALEEWRGAFIGAINDAISDKQKRVDLIQQSARHLNQIKSLIIKEER